jgi:hypothetical protein
MNLFDSGTYTGAHIGKEIKHKIGKTFDELIAEAAKPPAVPEEIAKYVDALVQGTHEITEVTIRPKKTWVGLTDDEIQRIIDVTPNQFPDYMMRFAWNLQQQLKEKNT